MVLSSKTDRKHQDLAVFQIYFCIPGDCGYIQLYFRLIPDVMVG